MRCIYMTLIYISIPMHAASNNTVAPTFTLTPEVAAATHTQVSNEYIQYIHARAKPLIFAFAQVNDHGVQRLTEVHPELLPRAQTMLGEITALPVVTSWRARVLEAIRTKQKLQERSSLWEGYYSAIIEQLNQQARTIPDIVTSEYTLALTYNGTCERFEPEQVELLNVRVVASALMLSDQQSLDPKAFNYTHRPSGAAATNKKCDLF